MDNLISSFEKTNISTDIHFESICPIKELIRLTHEIELALISTVPNEELENLYQNVEKFNNYLKTRIDFNPETYTDNYILQNIIINCNKYFNLSYYGSIRNRLLQSFLLYSYMIIAIMPF